MAYNTIVLEKEVPTYDNNKILQVNNSLMFLAYMIFSPYMLALIFFNPDAATRPACVWFTY